MAKIPHCDYGNHDVTDGTFLQRCAVCERSVCFIHQGNRNALAGSYVACLDHINEVAEMNRAWWEESRRNQQSGVQHG